MRDSGRAGWLALAGALLLSAGCALAQERAALLARGRDLFTEQGCHGCHTVGAAGTPLAPDLTRIGSRYTESDLGRWLRDPIAQRPTAHMPQIRLGEAEVAALSAYLASLR